MLFRSVTEDEITRLKVSKDHDDGRSIYEVDFTVASTGEEYDYEISNRLVRTSLMLA